MIPVKAYNGMTALELARHAYLAHEAACGLQGDFEKVTEDHRLAFMEVAGLAIAAVDMPHDEQAVKEINVKEAAKAIFRRWWMAQGSTVPEWDEQDQKTRLVWEAVFRHLANWIDSDGVNSGVAGSESRWGDWVKKKLESLTLVQGAA